VQGAKLILLHFVSITSDAPSFRHGTDFSNAAHSERRKQQEESK
jgi:hypothetical protein